MSTLRWVIGATMLLATAFSSSLTLAQTSSPEGDISQDRQDRRDLRGDRRDVREDRRDLRQDTRDIQDDRQDIHRDEGDLRQGRQQLQQDERSGVPAPTIELTATDAIKGTITQLITILNDQELKHPGRSGERRRQIEQVIKDRVNFEEMAKQSLGSPWNTLNDGERRDFVDLFTQLLRDGFANRFFEYSDEKVEYLDERSEGNSTELRTRLRGSKVDIPITYRLMNTARGWLVYDVVIDGVDIVHNYRAQFTAFLRHYSYVDLVKTMRQRALVQKVFERNLSP